MRAGDPQLRSMYFLCDAFLEARLAAGMSTHSVVIGVGNPFRGDDGVGLLVAQCLTEQAPACVRVMKQSRAAFALLEEWDKIDRVIVVDAVVSGAPPGTLHRLDVHEGPLPIRWFHA